MSNETTMMNDTQYRAFLDLMMCSDPWPVPVRNGIDANKVLEDFAHDEALKRGFDGWIVAYHEFNPVSAEAIK